MSLNPAVHRLDDHDARIVDVQPLPPLTDAPLLAAARRHVERVDKPLHGEATDATAA